VNLTFDHDKEILNDILGITGERVKELEVAMKQIVESTQLTYPQVTEQLLAHAVNDNERFFLIFSMGTQMGHESAQQQLFQQMMMSGPEEADNQGFETPE
jgi:hypothetical protein